MSGFTINIEGDLNKKLDKITADVKQTINDELNGFGIDTVASAKLNIKANGTIDEGFLFGSITFEKTEMAVEIIVAANYAAYLEFGTRAFAAAYVSTLPSNWQEFAATFKGGGGGGFADYFRNILEWCKRKGIEESAAYPIAISILRNGIRPRPYLLPAIEENLIKLKERLKTI